VTGKKLDVSQRSACLVNESRGAGDKSTASRMRRAAVETESLIGAFEPDHDTEWLHWTAPLRANDWPRARRRLPQSRKGLLQLGVERDHSSASHLRRVIAKFEHDTDLAASALNHLPR
jgi:hypothetical protein